MHKFSLIITAGGTSSRYGNKNKLLEYIDDKMVIEHSLAPFLQFDEINQIIVVANVGILETLKKIFANKNIEIIEGGKTRQESVYNGLQCVKNQYVIVHDGARPLITSDIIKKVMSRTIEYGATSVMSKTTDTIKEVDESGRIIRTIDRSKLYNTQTPQAFKTNLIKEAHNKLKDKTFTDDSSMLEELGIPVYITEGNYTNIKITSKCDLDFAKLYI